MAVSAVWSKGVTFLGEKRMTGEEIEFLFEKHDKEFVQFERIPEADRRHPRKDLCAMLYLHDRFGFEQEPRAHRDAVACAEHDQIWLDWEVDKIDLAEEDIIYLSRCGVRYDADNETFCLFV